MVFENLLDAVGTPGTDRSYPEAHPTERNEEAATATTPHKGAGAPLAGPAKVLDFNRNHDEGENFNGSLPTKPTLHSWCTLERGESSDPAP